MTLGHHKTTIPISNLVTIPVNHKSSPKRCQNVSNVFKKNVFETFWKPIFVRFCERQKRFLKTCFGLENVLQTCLKLWERFETFSFCSANVCKTIAEQFQYAFKTKKRFTNQMKTFWSYVVQTCSERCSKRVPNVCSYTFLGFQHFIKTLVELQQNVAVKGVSTLTCYN